MAKKNTPKVKAVEGESVQTEDTLFVEAPIVEAPKKRTPKAVAKFDPKSVSQSTKSVTFEWSTGKKSGTKETMSENVAEIMDHKGLGKKVK